MKICSIVGARPQFIKAATVSREFARLGAEERLIHTGQHYDIDMSDVFFEQMKIPKPHYQLGIGGGMHGAMTGRQLEAIEDVLVNERPDWVLVFGDTNSTLAGALAAAKLHIPVAHVEAGLRSFNRRMPEEVNRVLTDHVSTLLFSPTQTAVENLAKEGIVGEQVCLVGDVMYDAALFYKTRGQAPAWFSKLGLPDYEFVLCTIHRAENTEDVDRLRNILLGLGDSGLPVLLPLHPRTRKVFDKLGLQIPQNIHLAPPVGYLEMCWLEEHCGMIATDSGGVQKEAFFHGKPCITLRDETEWVELVEHRVNQLVGADANAIAHALHRDWPSTEVPGLFGHGDSANKIAERLVGMSS